MNSNNSSSNIEPNSFGSPKSRGESDSSSNIGDQTIKRSDP